MKKNKLGRKNTNLQIKKKKSPTKYVSAKADAERDGTNMAKERPTAQKWSRGKRVLRVLPQQAKLPICKRKSPKGVFTARKQLKTKAAANGAQGGKLCAAQGGPS